MDSEQATFSFRQFMGIARRRGAWIGLCFVVAAIAAFALSKSETKKYTAVAAVSFNSNQLDSVLGLSTSSGANEAAVKQKSNVELVKLGDAADKTAGILGHGLSPEAVSSSLSINAQGETGIVSISANSTSPALAAGIATTYAKQFVQQQRQSTRQFLDSALALVKSQLAKMSPLQRFGSDGLDLQERAHTLSLLAGLGYSTVTLAQEAEVPHSASSPRTKRNTVLGGLLGLVVGLFLALVIERADDRLREGEDLDHVFAAPVLGAVPRSASLSRAGAQGADLEPFGLIRARMRLISGSHETRTVMVVSPDDGEGKTTIARRLAEAGARAGSRVLLLEVDLREPTLAQQAGVPPTPGLVEVLTSTTSAQQAISAVDVPGSPGAPSSLSVLVAGTRPANPTELIESSAMDSALSWMRSAYDLVVIDTPPLTTVSDAFPLLTKVDGVLVVCRLGRTRRAAADRLVEVLRDSRARVLGVVVNGVKGRVPYSSAVAQRPSKPSATGGAQDAGASHRDPAPTT